MALMRPATARLGILGPAVVLVVAAFVGYLVVDVKLSVPALSSNH